LIAHGDLDSLDLLSDLRVFLIAVAVWDEVWRHRSKPAPEDPGDRSHVVDVSDVPSPRLGNLVDSFRLDAGEAATLLLMDARRAQLFLTDDAAARLAAESLGFPVHGTIGILVRSIRRGLRTRSEVLQILRRLPGQTTLHVSRDLLVSVIAKVEGDPK